MKNLFWLGMLVVGCSSVSNFINADEISDIYLCKTPTNSGNTFVSINSQLSHIEDNNLYHLNKSDMNFIVDAIKKATKTTFRQGKFGKGLICCKIKRNNDESMDNVVICRNEKCILIYNLSNEFSYSIIIQSEEGKRLITFLRTFYQDDKIFTY